MSDLRRSIRSQPKLVPLGGSVSQHSRLRRRLPYYAGAALIVLLVVAWIDGGEEPIRQITQEVILPERGA
ncbi:MAG: hypothetical protein AAF941_10125 [Pseudomonadota bacterium]